MTFAYYPGCSLVESAREFDVSVRAVLERFDVEFQEIPDWTCCGASAAESVSHLMNYALPARNLAIVEREMDGVDVIAPCSACYLNLLKVDREVVGDRVLHGKVNEVLAASGLSYSGGVRVRHLLDILLNEVGAEIIRQRVVDPLEGMKVAPYYGCQILRPYSVFDNPRQPSSMTPILEALGAEVHEWDMGARCCGASLMATHQEAALESVAAILSAAEGAEAVVTVCPMCQMNLDAYQPQAVRVGGRRVPVLYLSQLMGLALGMSQEDMLVGQTMSVTETAKKRMRDKAWRVQEPSGESAEEPVGADG
ncbi:CoB--CoM heterodisulfide reductase iron-sulfur subunit B family protein [Pseudodesulfovibrio tunisiensis]|uniref:CoB--CoM heterodisulfide reductase iron-sulfur subunit B family protein n=1 Tax=Pseudodesulfovibrio tunisiensis TaxID=463192 RepID=UPI001FB284FF|nr:CoB--CoM heterodisulfide reductase iron-sulfur subunit B family protein [Pseudodesulfovibrio tunisiensis]